MLGERSNNKTFIDKLTSNMAISYFIRVQTGFLGIKNVPKISQFSRILTSDI